MSKAAQIRSLRGTPEGVAVEVGCTVQYVREVLRRGEPKGKPGRPRKHVHPAEACARMLEDWLEQAGGADVTDVRDLANQMRAGVWRQYAQ